MYVVQSVRCAVRYVTERRRRGGGQLHPLRRKPRKLQPLSSLSDICPVSSAAVIVMSVALDRALHRGVEGVARSEQWVLTRWTDRDGSFLVRSVIGGYCRVS